MHCYGLPTSKIVGYMAGIAGGYSNLGFTKKDAYNYVDKAKRSRIQNGDVNAAVAYLEGKATSDPLGMAKYNIIEDGMFGNLVWADGSSWVDFQHFGDVLAFNATYKKNKYRRPLVIFSGSNKHKQTCIFGFGLIIDETIQSYTWLLENFLEIMCNKAPDVVVTDGDDAMISAVKKVFPRATHRLCAWHLQKIVTSNANEQKFRDIFSRWLYADMEVADFEREWAQAMDDFCLAGKLWADQMYEKRQMWANAFLCKKFCAGFRTTSRCEGINSYVKKFLNTRHGILELIQNLEILVGEYRNNELQAQFNSIYNEPVMTTCLDPLERAAAKVFTRCIFLEVKGEIEAVSTLNLIKNKRVSTTLVFTMLEYGNPGRPWVTLFDKVSLKFECRCGFWERKGIPCRHIFFVLKFEHIRFIPERLVKRRWTKHAKSIGEYVEVANDSSERSFILRHGALHAATQWMVFVRAKKQELFKKAIIGIRKLCKDLESCENKDNSSKHRSFMSNLRDPVATRKKGASSQRGRYGKKRRCTACKQTGHTRRRCTQMAMSQAGQGVDNSERSKRSRKGPHAHQPGSHRKRMRTEDQHNTEGATPAPEAPDAAEVAATQQSENVPGFTVLGVDDVSAQVMHIIQNINKSLGDRPGRHLSSG